jgi:hypothetical protein
METRDWRLEIYVPGTSNPQLGQHVAQFRPVLGGLSKNWQQLFVNCVISGDGLGNIFHLFFSSPETFLAFSNFIRMFFPPHFLLF